MSQEDHLLIDQMLRPQCYELLSTGTVDCLLQEVDCTWAKDQYAKDLEIRATRREALGLRRGNVTL